MRSHTAMVLALCTVALGASNLDGQVQTRATDDATRITEERLYMRAVGREYGVSGRELEVLQAWITHPAELPVLLFVATKAGVSTDVVGSLRNAGRSWQRIALQFGLGPATFRVPIGDAVVEGVYYRPMREFSKPAGQWHEIAMTDLEIVALVNLRLLANQLGAAPQEVLPEVRGLSPDFVGAYSRVVRTRAGSEPPPA